MADQVFLVKTGYSGSGANLTSIPNSALTNSSITINGTPVSLGGSVSNLATTTDVSTAISNLVNSAPSTLDTLNELATALGNDANFSTTITNSLAAKAPLSNPTFTTIGGDEGGQINFGIPATNTTLNTSVALDIYQNKLRIFETGGSNRGASLDITTLSNSLGSELLAAAPQSGNSGKFLTTDGTNASWATVPSGGGFTQLATGNLSGSSVSISNISGNYTDLYLQVRGSNLSTNASERIRPNGATTNYMTGGFSGSTAGFLGYQEENNGIYMNIPVTATNKSGITTNEYVVYFYDYANTSTSKIITSYRTPWNSSTNREAIAFSITRYSSNSAITSIDITTDAGTFSGGSYILYGVK